jgi:hypothetical protein
VFYLAGTKPRTFSSLSEVELPDGLSAGGAGTRSAAKKAAQREASHGVLLEPFEGSHRMSHCHVRRSCLRFPTSTGGEGAMKAGIRNSLILTALAVFGALAAGSSIGCDSADNDPNLQQDAETYAVSAADLKTVETKIRGPIRFEVPFDHIPDFVTVDQTGRTKDSFEYYISYDPTQDADSGTVQGAIVRGDEIHVASALRIRNALPSSTDPTSGGWGTVRATVPFEMRFNRDGSAVLSFVASWSDLGISGSFAWALDTFHFGAAVGSLKGVFAER